MANYFVSFSNQALKALEKIDEPHYSKIKKVIYSLSDDPRPVGIKKLTDRKGYRIRVGDYRIIYDILDSILVIEIITLGHRKNVYG